MTLVTGVFFRRSEPAVSQKQRAWVEEATQSSHATLFSPCAAPIQDQAEQHRGYRATQQLELKSQLVCRVSGRHQRNEDAEQHDDETQAAADPDAEGATWYQHGVGVLIAVLAVYQFDDGREHVEKWDEVENDGGVDQELIGTTGAFVDLAAQQDCARNHGLHQDGDVRRFPAGMDLAEGGG